MTRDEFIQQFRDKKGDAWVDMAFQADLDVFECDCGEPNCQGWRWDLSREKLLRLYGGMDGEEVQSDC